MGRCWLKPSVLLVTLVITVPSARAADDDKPRAPAGEATAAAASASAADKSRFTLFNPTPTDQLREFNPDRPSVTNSPFTVDAGHVQVELSLVEYAYDSDQGARADSYSILPAQVRVGVLNNVEFELGLQPYLNQHTKVAGRGSQVSGFGDLRVGLKINLWGDDGPGPTAFGLIPFLTLPTGHGELTTGHLQGGLALPFAASLPGGFDLGVMLEFDIDRDAANDGYGVDILHTLSIGHKIVGNLSGYVEYFGFTPVRLGAELPRGRERGFALWDWREHGSRSVFSGRHFASSRGFSGGAGAGVSVVIAFQSIESSFCNRPATVIWRAG